MEDVQKQVPEVALDIDRVGVRGLKVPLSLKDRSNGLQNSVATVDLSVDLPANYRGTHMSRFIEILEDWDATLAFKSLENLLSQMLLKLQAKKAHASFNFTYFLHKKAPSSKIASNMAYNCQLTSELDSSGQYFLLELKIPVMTVCPCSKAISKEGAHSQRSIINLAVKMTSFNWIEDFISMAEASGSAAVYTLLKREDEKYITEAAFANPCFVEDVVRNIAQKLIAHGNISWFCVEVESQESIHNHNAFARIERQLI